MSPGSTEAIAFGERVLSLLEQGRFTATYKYAVLLALIDVCLESTDRTGRGPSQVPVSALADKIAELYWRQTEPFGSQTGTGHAMVLRQNVQGQAEMVSLVAAFRERSLGGHPGPLSLARVRDPGAYRTLRRNLEWKLAQMPLPRLQLIGKTRAEFLYTLDWDESIARSAYFGSDGERQVRLAPGAGDQLIRLSGLLRPLIQREWANWIARHSANRALVKDAYLDEFLFGAERIALGRVRDGLEDVHAGHCFYCGRSARRGAGDIDHFIPWSRSTDNGIENLVLACRPCNNSKRNHLAASRHVIRWSKRFDPTSVVRRELMDIAKEADWESDPERTVSVARALYTRLPEDVLLWESRELVVPAGHDSRAVRLALAR
jgi:5-methylcytosine-specific restriction endonuclease McrA